MRQFDLKRIESAFDWLQKEFEDTDVLQSVDDLISKMNAINTTISWAYEMMALAKKALNEAKEQAYIELNASPVSKGKLYSPSLAKDYINSKCSKENFEFDLVERLCRSCVHVSDNLRTSISAMKEMHKMEQYGGGGYNNF